MSYPIKLLFYGLSHTNLYHLICRLSNDDVGGHFHSAKGSRNKVVRGRFGSRNPSNGRIEETEYTAGPRG